MASALFQHVPLAGATSSPIENWAVIVTGTFSSKSAWYNGSMAAYNTLLNIGYTHDNIYYLDVANRDDGRFDAYATKDNVKSAIENWLNNYSDNNDICVIFFNSHGDDTGGGFLYLNNNTEELYYSEINQYLQNVEYGRLIIVIDACYSGSAIDDLNATDRIVISSAKATEVVGISIFSEYFWPQAETNNIMKAFNNASWETWNFTTNAPNPDPTGEWPQHPQLDDNSDGVGNWSPTDPLPKGGDGYLAKATYLNPAEMVNLEVFTEGTDATELTNVDVTVNVTANEDVGSLYRLSPVRIILGKDSYTVEVEASVTQGGYAWNFAYWEDGSTSNPRSLQLLADKTITAYYEKAGGCPYVYVWNGTGYVVDNNVLPASETSNGSDVEDYYRLEQPLVPRGGKYQLLMGEFENERSYFDQVELFAVDHESDVNVALTPAGEILTYKDLYPPFSAIDNYGNNLLPVLEAIGDNYYRGYPGDYVLLDFGSLDVSQAAKLVIRANVEFKKDTCIHVQVVNETGYWVDRAVLRTRNNWSTQIVDLSNYLPDANGELKVRLYFTGIHKIDYVGLDTSKQAEFELRYANLVSAIHSTQGNIKELLRKNDGNYAELFPNEQIQLAFALPKNKEEARTLIIYVKGHYHTITNED